MHMTNANTAPIELTADEIDMVSGASVAGDAGAGALMGAGLGATYGTIFGGPAGGVVGALAGAVGGAIGAGISSWFQTHSTANTNA